MSLTELLKLTYLLLKWALVVSSSREDRSNALELARTISYSNLKTFGVNENGEDVSDIPF